MPLTVFLVEHFTGDAGSAPYIAGALVMGLQVIISFFGHRSFSFGASGTPGIDGGGRESAGGQGRRS